MQVTLLGALNGEKIIVSADGDNEEEAVNTIAELIEKDFELETTSKK